MTAATHQPARPAALPVDPGNLPVALRELRQWVVWEWHWLPPGGSKPGRWTKVPLRATTHRRASSTDPHTWASFAEALARADRDQLPGVGFVFTKDDAYLVRDQATSWGMMR